MGVNLCRESMYIPVRSATFSSSTGTDISLTPRKGIFARLRSSFKKQDKEVLSAPQKPFLRRTWHKWSGQLAVETEIADIFLLEKFINLSESLKVCDIPATHPCNELAARSRDLLRDVWRVNILDKTTKIRHVFKELEKYHNQEQERRKGDIENFTALAALNSGSATNAWRWDCEAALRLSLTQVYCQRLVVALEEGEIPVDNLHDEDKIIRLLDAFLLGSSDQRIEEHLRLYLPALDQASLQNAFYVMYDPEVATVGSALKIVRGLHKDLAKQIPKFADSYLLDRLELNVKSRSVFCWSDPNFNGIKPLADDHVISIEDLVKSRAEYFEEGGEVGKQFMEALTGDRRVYYFEKKELRSTARKGALFWLGCVVLDSYFTNM